MTQSSSDPSSSPAAAAEGDGRSPSEPTPLEHLGLLLQQAREARGLSREALAGQLNMGLEQLQALETADRSRLPETVFIVAQARRVASQLQVDIDAPIQALRRSLPSGSRPPGPTASTASTAGRGSTAPSASASGRSAVERPLAGPPKPPEAAARPPAAASSPGSAAPAPSPLGALVGALAWLALLAGLGTAATLGWNRWQQAQAPQRPDSTGPVVSNPTNPAPAASSSPAPAAATPTSDDQLVLITASEPSWLDVQTLEGQTLFRGSLEGRRSFPLGTGLRVLAGRPDLVQVQRGSSDPELMGPIEDVRPRIYEPGPPASGADPAVSPPAR